MWASFTPRVPLTGKVLWRALASGRSGSPGCQGEVRPAGPSLLSRCAGRSAGGGPAPAGSSPAIYCQGSLVTRSPKASNCWRGGEQMRAGEQQMLEQVRAALRVESGLLLPMVGCPRPYPILIRHIRGMDPWWKGATRPALWSDGSDRGCPLDTVIDLPIWHASGTARPMPMVVSRRSVTRTSQPNSHGPPACSSARVCSI